MIQDIHSVVCTFETLNLKIAHLQAKQNFCKISQLTRQLKNKMLQETWIEFLKIEF